MRVGWGGGGGISRDDNEETDVEINKICILLQDCENSLYISWLCSIYKYFIYSRSVASNNAI